MMLIINTPPMYCDPRFKSRPREDDGAGDGDEEGSERAPKKPCRSVLASVAAIDWSDPGVSRSD